jgi:hypothetical protein
MADSPLPSTHQPRRSRGSSPCLRKAHPFPSSPLTYPPTCSVRDGDVEISSTKHRRGDLPPPTTLNGTHIQRRQPRSPLPRTRHHPGRSQRRGALHETQLRSRSPREHYARPADAESQTEPTAVDRRRRWRRRIVEGYLRRIGVGDLGGFPRVGPPKPERRSDVRLPVKETDLLPGPLATQRSAGIPGHRSIRNGSVPVHSKSGGYKTEFKKRKFGEIEIN